MIFLGLRQWQELIGSPMCAPSSDKTSFCGRFERVEIKNSKILGEKLF
jgi:hypothetical protein